MLRKYFVCMCAFLHVPLEIVTCVGRMELLCLGNHVMLCVCYASLPHDSECVLTVTTWKLSHVIVNADEYTEIKAVHKLKVL